MNKNHKNQIDWAILAIIESICKAPVSKSVIWDTLDLICLSDKHWWIELSFNEKLHEIELSLRRLKKKGIKSKQFNSVWVYYTQEVAHVE